MHTMHTKQRLASRGNISFKQYPEFDEAKFMCCFFVTFLGGIFLISGNAAVVLQKAQVRVINYTVCDDLMGGQLTSRMLCAGVLSGGVDACQVITEAFIALLSFSLLQIKHFGS